MGERKRKGKKKRKGEKKRKEKDTCDGFTQKCGEKGEPKDKIEKKNGMGHNRKKRDAEERSEQKTKQNRSYRKRRGEEK